MIPSGHPTPAARCISPGHIHVIRRCAEPLLAFAQEGQKKGLPAKPMSIEEAKAQERVAFAG